MKRAEDKDDCDYCQQNGLQWLIVLLFHFSFTFIKIFRFSELGLLLENRTFKLRCIRPNHFSRHVDVTPILTEPDQC